MNEQLTLYGPSELAPGETREPEVNSRGQFKIKCPDGKARWYTRCTTFIDCLSDRTTLEKWKQRVILIGLQKDRELMRTVAFADPDDRDELNELAEAAFEAGDGYLKSRKGTDRHKITELWDAAQELPELDEEAEADLRAYIHVTSERITEHLHVEQRVVNDELRVTGTPDRICTYEALNGKTLNVIADLKTGSSVNYDAGKIAQQMAVYASGQLYTDNGSPTGVRTPLPDVSREIGLLIHAPQGEATAKLYEVNLMVGWAGVAHARAVREWRNYSKRVLTEVPL